MTRLELDVPDDVSEEWQTCPSYPLYEASDLGRVRRKGNARLIAQRINKQGYAITTLSLRRQIFVRFVHVLVLDAFVGPKPAEHFVQHIDGNKLNNLLSNLRYARGYSYSGATPANLSTSNQSFLESDAVWTISERGYIRWHADSLEKLVEMGIRAVHNAAFPEQEVLPDLE